MIPVRTDAPSFQRRTPIDTPQLGQRLFHHLFHRDVDERERRLLVDQAMEVILVQGPAQKLQAIAEEMITPRGIISGKMQLIAAVIPPLHPLPRSEPSAAAPSSAGTLPRSGTERGGTGDLEIVA